MRLEWSQLALEDRDGIFDYIEQDNPFAAIAVDERISRQVGLLIKFPECGPSSYQFCFRQYLFTTVVRQSLGGQYVNGDTQQLTQFIADCSNIHKRGVGCRFDEQIQVALVGVVTMQDRAEYTDFLYMMAQCDLADRIAMGLQG